MNGRGLTITLLGWGNGIFTSNYYGFGVSC